ncbi:uncharacterized protein LOC133857032 isoform X3 [Alnus glutinosa]|uniref:uncharacterized protein LOC133857032 isoform X3 n=1 Tax=Alnus glutinosa TaxID=3517 RepID=UPI002D766309|nr:uncharacterized protein LOC133857032 isoform X3 [Alnus glutinosa]
MHTRKSLQGISMENKILTSHSGTSESSRKRKLIAVNKQDTISASDHEYSSPKEASLRHETGLLSGRNVGENSFELFSNQSPPFIEPTIFRHRSDKGQFDGENNLPETKQTCIGYFCKAGAEKISNSSPSVLLQSFHHRGSPPSKKENDRGHAGGNIQILKQVEGAAVENFKCSFLEETGPKNGDCPPTVDIRNDLSHGSFKSYKKSKSLVRKEAPTVAKKLWEGSLQLNSSVTVLAVAFFKSGEKMPNIKWSESIEVKGKVRFEAFEKYIQDLPRSRNRGLMDQISGNPRVLCKLDIDKAYDHVISLCWKEGSSESGLAGMKKVAKGYKDGERVGFAPLSPGMDLYICPRSETIITILAKHGFFKGMAAVEDNQDSLIGCVVWRRNRANSNTVVKKPERKNCSFTEQPVNSPPDASTLRVVEDSMSHAQPAEESIPVASGTDYATLESTENYSIETKNVEPSNVQLELHNQSAIIKPLDSLGQSLEVEAPLMHNSGREKAKPSLELHRPVLSLPSEVINKVASLHDDDDLPEFDFGISPVISQTLTSNPLDAVITNMKLPSGGPWKMDGSLPTMEPTLQSLIFHQRRLENSNLAKLPVGAIQKKTPLENFVDHGKIFGFPIWEEKHTAQNIAVSTRRGRTAVPFSSSRFGEDEDDMPEWCPPEVELHKQTIPETNQSSPYSTFEVSPGPTTLLPSPSLVAIHPPFSALAFPRAYNCHNTVSARSTQPRPANGYMPRDPSSFMRLNSETLLRPTSNTFDVKFPVHPASWRGWRS